MSHSPVSSRGAWALGIAVICAIAGAVAASTRWPLEDWRLLVPDLLVGWAFLASGALIAGRLGGSAREGLLVAAVGASWLLADVVPGLALLHRGVLVHAAVAMPRGRVGTPIGRAVVVAAYGAVLMETFVPSPLIPMGLALGLVAVARASGGPRRSACLLVGALLGTQALASFTAGDSVGSAVLLPAYSVGLVVEAVALYAIHARATSRTDVTDLVVEMGPRDALAELIRRDPTVREDPALPAAVAAADRLRAAHARLTEDLERQIAAVDASRRRLLAAQDEERALLEDRLQRGPAGRLARVSAELAAQASSVPAATDRLAAAREQVGATRRDLGLIAAGLYPAAIADGSLESALESVAAASPIPVDLDLRVTSVGPDAAAVVYFVCSEAVVNAARHSRAVRISVRVQCVPVDGDRAEVVVDVDDDGVGGADPQRGSGLQGLADRVGIAGGELRVESGPSGTRVHARVPDGSGAISAEA